MAEEIKEEDIKVSLAKMSHVLKMIEHRLSLIEEALKRKEKKKK